MSTVHFLFYTWAVMAVVMGLLWLWQRATDNAGVVDVGWTGGVGVAILAIAWVGEAPVPRRVLIGGLAAVWSVRLCLYIWRDRIHGKAEDARYTSLRSKWGDKAAGLFLLFFQMQAVLVPVFALPAAVAANHNLSPLGWFDALGVGLFLLSIGGESLADRQLMQFRNRSEHAGATCRAGLWRYSRHPNYFFEWLHWWAYPCFAAGAAGWPLTLIGPALMLFFLFKVTGIPATEARALASRGEDYRAYQRTTSVFIPWFPKKDASSS